MNTDMIITSVEPECTAYTIDSREVAEMVEKTHSKLLKDLRRYSGQLAEAKIGLGDFWTESSYMDSNTQERPCYLITKKGCEFIAHKMTGTKGTVFTARYIERFHEMEEALKADQTIPGVAGQVPPAFMEFMRKQDAINQKQAEMNDTILRQQEQVIWLIEEQQRLQEPLPEPEDEPEVYLQKSRTKSETKRRVSTLNRKVRDLAYVRDATVTETYHKLYETIEYKLNLDLSSLMKVYRWETNEESNSPIYAIAAHGSLYEYALGILNNTINQEMGGRS